MKKAKRIQITWASTLWSMFS